MPEYHEIALPGPSEVTMALMRNTIWHGSSKKSIVSGLWLRCYLYTPLFVNCFLHILDPNKFPYFKFYFKNIALVTPGELGLWEKGSEEERIQYSLGIEEQSRGKTTANWGILKTLDEELRAEYSKYFPITKGMIVGHIYTLNEQQKIIGRLNKEYFRKKS
jgi:hypothetical protein